MAAHSANRANGKQFYYVCRLRRSNHGRCAHGVRYHRAEDVEQKVRALVAGFLSRPEEVRRRAEEYVQVERERFSRLGRELGGWGQRLADTERRRSTLIDLAADGAITREDLRQKLDELDKEREACREEIRVMREGHQELEELESLPELAEQYARDLPHLLDMRRAVRGYVTEGPGRTEENPLGLYTVTPDSVRFLSEQEVEKREREADDRCAARYRAMYEDLGLRVVAYPDGTMEASWRFGEAALRNGSDKSKNKHATKHFHETDHPIVQSFQPGEDWRWCYVDEVLI
jgi:hypothetical protein